MSNLKRNVRLYLVYEKQIELKTRLFKNSKRIIVIVCDAFFNYQFDTEKVWFAKKKK